MPTASPPYQTQRSHGLPLLTSTSRMNQEPAVPASAQRFCQTWPKMTFHRTEAGTLSPISRWKWSVSGILRVVGVEGYRG